jgi:hypothetical protein
MSRHHKGSRWPRLLRSLYIWHRYIGLTAALFVIVLAVTGWILNHTEGFALDTRYVHAETLLDWYGVNVPRQMVHYDVGTHSVTQVGERLYWDDREIPGASGTIIGAVDLPDMVVVALEGQLLLFTPSGELIEQLGDAAGVPAGMRRVGVGTDDTLAVQAAHGDYEADDTLVHWRESGTARVDWSQPSAVPDVLREKLAHAYRGSGLTIERVLLDVHSGRILGQFGVYLVDAAAVLFVLLGLTGVWLWTRRLIAAREHRKGPRHYKAH